MNHLSDVQKQVYANDGLLLVRDAIPRAVVDNLIVMLEAEVDRRARKMLAAGEVSNLHEDESFTKRWYRLIEEYTGNSESPSWHASVFSPPLYALWTHESILDVVESLIGPEIQVSGDYILRPMIPSQNGALLPWHQDSGYMNNTGQYHWPTVWVPIVPVSEENGAMQFIPGTHTLPVQENVRSGNESETFATPNADPAAGREVITPEMKPGDFVVFHNHVFHRSTRGTAASVRWSIDFRFSPAGTPVSEELWFHGMRHVVRSKQAREQVPTWDQVVSLWERSEQRLQYP